MAAVLHHNDFSASKFCFYESRCHSPFHQQFFRFPVSLRIKCADKARRTGKLRYPSERKKKHRQLPNLELSVKPEGVWKVLMLGVSVQEDPGKDFYGLSEALMKEIAKILEFPVASMLPPKAFIVKEPKLVYTVDMDVTKMITLEPRTWEFLSELKPKVGRLEFLHRGRISGDLMSTIQGLRVEVEESSSPGEVVHGHNNSNVTVIERGNAVEQRGRDIGALVVRRMLQLERNFCFGEVPGAMGSW